MDAQYIVELLDKTKHDLKFFFCGVKDLDLYIKEKGGQDIRKKVSAVYVIHESERKEIEGYYSLSSYSIRPDDLPKDAFKKFPKYPLLPATLIGRFAVDVRSQDKGLGKYLLHDALFRSYKLSRQIGSIAVVFDAKNKKSGNFYLKFGFKLFPKHPLKLYLPMKTIKNLIIA